MEDFSAETVSPIEDIPSSPHCFSTLSHTPASTGAVQFAYTQRLIRCADLEGAEQ
jgi:hypothetical protein